jgi:hypothetical protein
VLVDFTLPGATAVIEGIRHHNGNDTLVAAILGGETAASEAFALGAKFVLYEPLTLERALQGLRAVKSLMYPQTRQHVRKPAYAPVSLKFTAGREVNAVVLNVSEGGIAVRLPEAAAVRQKMRARFTLPGVRDPIDVQGEIAWIDKNCRAGIRFLDVPKELHRQLKQWLFPALRMTKREP